VTVIKLEIIFKFIPYQIILTIIFCIEIRQGFHFKNVLGSVYELWWNFVWGLLNKIKVQNGRLQMSTIVPERRINF
jgi:hypothetical protein